MRANRTTPKPPVSPAAFTLMETLLVLGILTALMALAWPSFRGMWEANQLQSAAEQLRASVRQCRRQAVADGIAYRIDVAMRGAAYRTLPSRDPVVGSPGMEGLNQAADPVDGAATFFEDETAPLFRIEEILPENCRFFRPPTDNRPTSPFEIAPTVSQAPGTVAEAPEPDFEDAGDEPTDDAVEWEPWFEFFPDGSALESEIAIGDDSGRYVFIKVRSLSGEVEISEVFQRARETDADDL